MNPIEKICHIKAKESRNIIGLMSGTSVDGVSIVFVKVSGYGLNTKFNIIGYKTYPYPKELKDKIFELFNPSTSTVDKICIMNFILGEFYSEVILRFIDDINVSKEDIDVIASHGQTIYHLPNPVEVGRYSSRSTLQIGEPSVIAERTGITVIADFRPRDIAAGGQGAPIIAYVDYILFRSENKSRAIQNIGGIANVTYLPKGCKLNKVVAFDTGPGNMVIDSIVRYITKGKMEYDINGKLALSGEVNPKLLKWLMSHPFIKRTPPKTTGREEFGKNYVRKVIRKAKELGVIKPSDLVATITAFTVESILYSYRKFLGDVDEIILGGGGAYNKAIVTMLKERISVPVKMHKDFGIPEQAKEPLGMAILANEALMGYPNNVPNATGATRRVIMGKIIPP